MNYSNRFLFCFVAIFCLFIQSCKKDNPDPDPIDNGGIETGNTVTASVTGSVKDEAGNPVSGASVKLGSNTATTDNNGLFFFHQVTTSERTSTVVVSKSGFFHGSRTFFVQSGSTHPVTIRLMAKGTAQTFNAASGGTVSFTGLTIDFPANGIVVKETGAAYSGQVYVYGKKIDPTTVEGRESMPGDLRGINTGGEERLLQSFGMMVAELYDNSGNALQIASTSSATLSLTVPASLLASAPTSIPLWYYDENKGMWMEEGSATLQGSNYIGNVKHFSFWNCDTPAAAIDFQIRLVDQNGVPLQGYKISLTNAANGDCRYGWTDDTGWVGGLVYPNASLLMNVSYWSDCGETSVHSQTVNTGSSNSDLGTIVVSISGPSIATIHATIQDCDNNPVVNGALYFPGHGVFVMPDANGTFNYTFPCVTGTETLVIAYDFESGVYGEATYSLHTGMNNFGVLTACGNAVPYMNFVISNDVTLQSESINSAFPNDYLSITEDASGFVLGANYSVLIRNLGLSVIGGSVGTLDLDFAYYGIDSLTTSSLPDTQFSFNPTGSSCTFSSFPAVGAVDGTFTAHFTGLTTGQPYTMTGSFKLLKW